MSDPREFIDRERYPELDAILWDDAERYVDPEEAFKMYERRWPYIEQKNLSIDEKKLLQHLIETFGNGVFLVA